MDVLAAKYKEHREEVLHALDVSKGLLSLLTREGLLDIADCVKYQGIADKKKRAQALMRTLTERRTDRAYGILIQCLREAGQGKAADLLTDIGEETHIIAQLQKQLDEQIKSLDGYLDQEEKRAGVDTSKAKNTECGHLRKGPKPEAAINDRQVWKGAQESMRRAVDQLDRCRAVIGKLHEDCQRVSETNAELMSQTRDCYLELSKLIRPNNKSANQIQTQTRTTQELFQLLVEDVYRLMTRKSKAQERESEGRTSAMRTLRQLRDWIIDRSTVLTTIHSTFSPLGIPRFSTSRSSFSQSNGQYLKTFKTSDQVQISQDQSNSLPSPPAIMNSSQVADPNGSFGRGHLPLPFATSTPQPTESRSTATSRDPEFHIQPISSVVEGVHHLEQQLRDYIHLEILLTDKFRHEMRMKQHQKKALGFSAKGLNEAQYIVNHLSTNGSAEVESLQKLQTQLDGISKEYSECCKYMDKVVSSMTQIDDVEAFLKNLHARELEYNKTNRSDIKNDNDKKKKKLNEKEREKLKANLSKKKHQDPYESLLELFKKGNHPKHHHQSQKLNNSVQNKTNAVTSSTKFLPSLTSSNDAKGVSSFSDDLLTKLKLLVANYEVVRLRMLTMEDRFRRESARSERKVEALVRARDDEIFRLQSLLRESDAEKEKFHRLYNATKIGAGRKG